MKKIILLISIVFIGVSCSSDDKEDLKDPVFDSEFIPLKSLDDLSGIYTYEGAKIGNRPFGAVALTNCLSNNTIEFGFSDKNKLFCKYLSFKKNIKLASICDLDFTRTINNIDFLKEGVLFGEISDYIILEKGASYLNEDIQDEDKVEFEVGMQAGYLRIEDVLSRNTLKEKSYLYFKKM